jgi:CheY-like chemotaxis protein
MTTLVEKSKILIVDDNPNNLYAFQAILRDPDLEIVTATSGEEALQILLEHQDTILILMDVNMPGMDGFETTELIRGQPKFQDIPILFITAVYKSDEFARRGFDIGAADYITKPVDGEVLESKVNVFLTLQKQKRQLAHEISERKRAEEALAQRVEELERFSRLAVGRELRMVELKRQVNELAEQLGKEPPYDLSLLE